MIQRYIAEIEAALRTLPVNRSRRAAVLEEQRELLSEHVGGGSSLHRELGTPEEYAQGVADALNGVGADEFGRRTTHFGALFASSRRRVFDPHDDAIVQPHLMGLGWSINWGAVAVKLGILRPDDIDADAASRIPAGWMWAARLTPVALLATNVGELARSWKKLPHSCKGSRTTLATSSVIAALSAGLPLAAARRGDRLDELTAISVSTLVGSALLAQTRAQISHTQASKRISLAAVATMSVGFIASGAVVVAPLRAGRNASMKADQS